MVLVLIFLTLRVVFDFVELFNMNKTVYFFRRGFSQRRYLTFFDIEKHPTYGKFGVDQRRG